MARELLLPFPLGPHTPTIIGEPPLHSAAKSSASIALAALLVVQLVEAGCAALAGANDVADLAEASLPVDATATEAGGGTAHDSSTAPDSSVDVGTVETAIDVGAVDAVTDVGAVETATDSAPDLSAPGPCTIPGTIAEFPLPGDVGKAPAGITSGPDGPWSSPGLLRPRLLADISSQAPRSVESPLLVGVTQFEVPNPTSEPLGIVAGPDGNLWMTEFQAGQIARITPADGGMIEFAIPSGIGQPNGITSTPDGTIWFTDQYSNAVDRISTAGTDAVELPIPTPNSKPTGIVQGSDGNLFGQNQASMWGASARTEDPRNPVPTPMGYENGIASGPDGNLWFRNMAMGRSAELPPMAASPSYSVPIPESSPWMVAAGPDGALWATDPMTNNIIRVTTAGVFTVYPIPTPNAGAGGIAWGPDGNVWFTETAVNKLGRVCFVAGSAYNGDESSAYSDAGAVVIPDEAGSESSRSSAVWPKAAPRRNHSGSRRQPVVHRDWVQQGRSHDAGRITSARI